MTPPAPAGLVFVGDRCCDHSPSSGYDQICSLFPQAGWLSGRALEAGDITWLRHPVEDGAPRPVFHVFYGDCSGRALPAILRSRFAGATVVLTVHRPVSRIRRDRAAMRALHDADAILTVSARQALELADLDVAAPVYAVPHGVWTPRFRPRRPFAGKRHEVLLVGNHLRDWQTTLRIIELLARADVRCRVVGTNAPRHLFEADRFVSVADRLSEPELAATYDRSAALLMPVLDATASNALLEAMSAGCPVVSTASPSLVDEYLGDRRDSFQHGEHDVAVTRLLQYVREPAQRAARALVLMERSQQFDWSNLAERYARVFREIGNALRYAPSGQAQNTPRRNLCPGALSTPLPGSSPG